MALEQNRPLLEGFRRGDPDALDRVYREYAEEVATVLIHGFAFRSGGRSARFHGLSSRFDLEDVLQEVFLRAFGARARLAYDGLRPYGAYLAAIARSAVIDRLRSYARWEARVLWDEVAAHREPLPEDAGNATDLLEGTVALGGNPVRDVENAELARLLIDFQDGLSPAESEVFRLRFREGKSLPDVERATGRSPSRVKTLERKLRERLLARIWEAGYLVESRIRSAKAAALSPAEYERSPARLPRP